MFFYYINEPKSEVSGPKSRFCILSPQAINKANEFNLKNYAWIQMPSKVCKFLEKQHTYAISNKLSGLWIVFIYIKF